MYSVLTFKAQDTELDDATTMGKNLSFDQAICLFSIEVKRQWSMCIRDEGTWEMLAQSDDGKVVWTAGDIMSHKEE